MKKTATKCASCGGKMKAGGTAKKKMMLGGATTTMGSCKDGDPKCKQRKTFGEMRNQAPKPKRKGDKDFRKG
jgi:hypothetical protein